jgi:predicted phosphodiesterase
VIYGVVSDVHSNLEAFEAVLAELERLGAERLLFLGDIVGYGADANACVERLEAVVARSVRGNHDRIVTGGEAIRSYAYADDEVQDADLWSRHELSPVNARRVADLAGGPLEVEDGILLCHGSPRDEDDYLTSWGEMAAAGALVAERHPGVTVCFFGHTHVPAAAQGRTRLAGSGEAVVLAQRPVALVNPGSVGQPRDGDPRASFGVYDSGRRVYVNHRVRYDVAVAGKKIVGRGLPRRFADRLVYGR